MVTQVQPRRTFRGGDTTLFEAAPMGRIRNSMMCSEGVCPAGIIAGGISLADAVNMSDPFILLPGEARRLELGNFQALVLATDDQTSGEFTLLQTQSEPPDFGPPMHLHRDAAEAFYVLEGEYLMYLQDRQQLCPPGTFVYIPRAVPHTFKVASPGPGKKLNLFSPAAMVGFFEELAEAEAAGTATPSELDRIAARHHMEVLGPVPDAYL